MMTKIKKNIFYSVFGLVATGIVYIGDCLSDAVIDLPGTQQCYNIGGHEVCYFIGSEQLVEWHLAYEICESKNSTLPIIRNADEQNALEKYLKYLQLKRSSIAFVWTAGKRINFNDWTWINGQPVSDKVRTSLHSEDNDDTHVQIMKNNSLRVRDPDSKSPFLCQFYGDRCLLSGRIKMTNSCVVFSNFQDSWFNARCDCLAREGDLPVLDDQDLQILKNYSLTLKDQQLPGYSRWIGLRKMSWYWQLDSKGKQTEEIKFNKWGRHVFAISGEECIHIEVFSGNWIRTECNKMHSVVCQIKGSTTITTTAPEYGSIGLLTFVLAISGVVLVCIAFSAIVGVIAARKASSAKNPGKNVYQPTSRGLAADYLDLQARPQSIYEEVIESSYIEITS